MRSIGRYCFVAVAFPFFMGVAGTPAQPIQSILVHAKLNPGQSMKFDFTKQSSITHALDLGEEWDGVFELVGPEKRDEFRVTLIYETSIAIQNEGAHLDLTKWRHYKSEPIALYLDSKSSHAHRYVIGENSIMPHAFPFTSKDELLNAVRDLAKKEKGGSRWEDLAKTCVAPQSYPCGVSVSKIWLQIFPKDLKQTKPLVELILQPPMGC